MIFKMPKPIPDTVKDPQDVTEFFNSYKIIPYYGTTEMTSHAVLDLYQVLTTYSPTFRSVTKDISFYTFGLSASIVGRVIPGLNLEPVELEPAQQIAYEAWLKERNILIRNLLRTMARADLHIEVSGNAWLVIRRIEVAGQVRYDFKVPHYKHVALLAENSSRPEPYDFAMITRYLYDPERVAKLSEYPPTILPVTPEGEQIIWAESEGETNVRKALIHLKKQNDDDESDYYARPDIVAILDWLYTEIKNGEQNSKIAATDLITKVLLAFQAPDPNTLPEEDPDAVWELTSDGQIGAKEKDYFARNMVVLKQLVTNLGKHPSAMGQEESAASIAGVEYPFSGVAPTPIDLEMNRDTKHQQFQLDMAIGQICQILRWAPELTSIRQTKTQLGGNLLYDLFTMKNQATIKPKQMRWETVMNEILGQILAMESGPAEFQGYGLKLPDNISDMISSFKGSGGSTTPGEASQATEPANSLNDDPDAVTDPNDPQRSSEI